MKRLIFYSGDSAVCVAKLDKILLRFFNMIQSFSKEKLINAHEKGDLVVLFKNKMDIMLKLVMVLFLSFQSFSSQGDHKIITWCFYFIFH